MPLAFVGEAGNAIIFICLLVATAVIGAYALVYAGRCLLVVVEETAAGNEEVSWPEEPVVDWLWNSLFLGLLLLLLLVPLSLLSYLLRDALFPGDGGLRFLAVAVPGLWLLFPIGLLSSLASTSRWVLLRPVILVRLLRLLPATLLFYLLSGVGAALAATAWYETLFGGYGWLLPVAAGLTALLWLAYARLLGRLAWLVGQLGPLRPEPPPRSIVAPPRKKGKAKRMRPQVSDPWAVPEEEPEDEADADAEAEVYGLSGEAAKPPPADLLTGEVPPEPEAVRRVRRQVKEAAAPPPGVPLDEGLAAMVRGLPAFAWSGRSLTPLMRLAFGNLVLGALAIGLLAFRPF